MLSIRDHSQSQFKLCQLLTHFQTQKQQKKELPETWIEQVTFRWHITITVERSSSWAIRGLSPRRRNSYRLLGCRFAISIYDSHRDHITAATRLSSVAFGAFIDVIDMKRPPGSKGLLTLMFRPQVPYVNATVKVVWRDVHWPLNDAIAQSDSCQPSQKDRARRITLNKVSVQKTAIKKNEYIL